MATALTKTEQLERDLKNAEKRNSQLQQKVSEGDQIIEKHKKQVADLVTRYQSTAAYGVGGFAIGGGAAYLFHDDVVEYFGADSWMGYLCLPALGALALYATTKIKDPPSKPGARLDDRVGLLGLGLGLLLGGGYMSYTTWPES
ncbi:hypothetical protein SAMN02745121_08564 [Nannocystis exedens]|uniref:Uncharacterized protein n=1 Tax=Nannocystis exedens TaxID=54 RepID=A0A1I2IAR6_9BACT|nr:hypothetical protein [Nannocystis exedens]PCC73147.1 hypothetical protein NAEX_06235 [Nannocystis exedens]SFF39304.1 hypothetical protein SAMN02745121_08564 [Nannocystis exedens]